MLKLRTSENNTTPARTLQPVHEPGVTGQSGQATVRTNNEFAFSSAMRQVTRKKRRMSGVFWTRPRKRALICLVILSLTGIRWHIANSNPVMAPLPIVLPRLSTPNAAHFYAAATDAFDYMNMPSYNSDTATLAEKKQLISKASDSLRLLREGFAYRYQQSGSNWYSNVPEERPLGAEAPNITTLRNIARVLIAEAQVAASKGRYADAVSSSLDAVRFGQDVGHGKSVIEGMVGMMCQGMGTNEALKHVENLSAADARAAITRLGTLISTESPFSSIAAQERDSGYALLRQTFSNSTGYPAAGFYYPFSRKTPLEVATVYNSAVFWYGKEAIFQSYRQYMDAVENQLSVNYQFGKTSEPAPSLSFLSPLRIFTSKTWQMWTRRATAKRILLARLAIQAYRQEHVGVLPLTLAELTHGESPYLKEVPVDLFSPSGASPLSYKDGVVYSVGENGKDDNNMGDDREVTVFK